MLNKTNKHFSTLIHKSSRQRTIEELTLRTRWLTKLLIENIYTGFAETYKHHVFENTFTDTKQPYPLYRRIIFKVLYQYGYKISEIAEVFGRNHSTVSRSIMKVYRTHTKNKDNELITYLKTKNEAYMSEENTIK